VDINWDFFTIQIVIIIMLLFMLLFLGIRVTP
jgi:hypothetical protein